jgi:hypothetical protein
MNKKQRFALTLNVTSASFAPAANAIAGLNLSPLGGNHNETLLPTAPARRWGSGSSQDAAGPIGKGAS